MFRISFRSWIAIAVFSCGVSQGQAQLPAEITPSVTNRNSQEALVEAADAAHASVSGSGGGATADGALNVVQSEFGYTFTAGTSDFSYGDEITPPLEDLSGTPLTVAEARAYWRAEPVKPGEVIQVGNVERTPVAPDFEERYYFSPHKDELIASHFGRIEVRWVTENPLDEFGNFGVTDQVFYTVGATSSLTTRDVYWTEFNFRAPRVQIPSGTIEEINIIYNDRLAATVAAEDRLVPVGVDERVVPDTTVWFDTSLEMLRAYNREGRVLIEYLGSARPELGENVREHLGLEVLRVSQVLDTVTVSSIIGEQLLPGRTVTETVSDVNLVPVQVSAAGPLVAQHFVDNRTVFYGIEENLQPPRVEFYWLEPSPINNRVDAPEISWPLYHNNYFIRWPEDIESFEAVFARPSLGTDGDLIAGSFIDLKATNTPELIFQDDPNGNEASLDFQFHFTVDLESTDPPVNRSLIRFNSGNEFRYIRLFSATADYLETIDAPGVGFDSENSLDFHITRNVVVGQRLEPPHESLALGGYIDPRSGDAYQESAYIDPFAEGGVDAASLGGIIPVNALPGNDQLRVWWFRELAPRVDQADLFSGVYVPTVIGDYTISYPGGGPEIVLASNAGTGELNSLQAAGQIYFQNDSEEVGYNPNEEHAITQGGRAYALRDDLNLPESSEPFVLLSYQDEDGRPDMEVFRVLRENAQHSFDYPGFAGRILQGPQPLPIIPQPIVDGRSLNEEVTASDVDPVPVGTASQNLRHYNRFTFQDRKGSTWIYRGPHAPESVPAGSEPKIGMQYYYPTLEGFWFPELSLSEQPEVGTIVPYLRELGSTESPVDGTPLTINFTPQWPEQTPVLHFGETLAEPKFGLPQIKGNSAVELLYQQSVARDTRVARPSVVLHDSTIVRVSPLDAVSGMEELPPNIATTVSRGRTFFQQLPTHLQERIYFNPLEGSRGALVLEGEFVDELAGEDYLLPNTLSEEEYNQLIALAANDNSLERTRWAQLVNQLTVTSTFKALDVNGQEISESYSEWLLGQPYSQVLGQDSKETYLVRELPQVVSPDQVVNDYFLSAIGGGDGYVTIVTGNGLVNSPQEEPVQMHVIRVGEKLYQGQLKPLVAANPLSENVTVIHTGDFASRPGDYNFEWRKAAPVNGLAPPAFSFENVTATSAILSPRLSRNLSSIPGALAWGAESATNLPFPTEIYESGADRSVPGLRLTASLDFSAQLPVDTSLDSVFLSLRLTEGDGAIVSVNGVEVIRHDALSGENSEPAANIPADLRSFLTNGGGYQTFRVPGRSFTPGQPNALEVLFSTIKADTLPSVLDLRVAVVRKGPPSPDYITFAEEQGKNRHVVSGSGIDVLGDNYYIMRYQDSAGVWSEWTSPALVEGWIKRVLAGINPFNQRVSDFFENSVDTNTSIIASAGSRWEGDVALTLDSVQDAGLIEIYETVLKRGINLSINGNPEIDYGPANDALLLAAGYLSDLYLALGNEAFSDAADPTVAFDGQALGTLGDAAVTAGFEENFRRTSTSRFAFQGQVASLLDEELALLRGRDDFLAPSVQLPPAYNRLFWNYTRGVDAGELIYALNYNIRELNDSVADGRVDAADAARLFPQAHGDAYGHYLTAVKNYYRLLTDDNFTWGTRIEAVNVLGQPVSIDYFDERKFATGAAAVVRTANQIISLERRKAFQEGVLGWKNLSDGRENDATRVVRHWGVDDWAARGGQGAYFHWLVGNSILPAEDLVNEGIQKIDRTTVPELDAIAKAAENIQSQLEAADARVNPLGLTEDSLLFDISPADLEEGETHFEQIYDRALGALKNANSVFERAADSTRLLRSLNNQSQNLTQVVDDEETAFVAELISIFGEPYPGDVGAGKFYEQGYTGPDLIRYMAIDRPYEVFTKDDLFAFDSNGKQSFVLNVRDDGLLSSFNSSSLTSITSVDNSINISRRVAYQLDDNIGPYLIVDESLGRRPSLGTIQVALNEVRLAEEQLYAGLAGMDLDRRNLLNDIRLLQSEIQDRNRRVRNERIISNAKFIFSELTTALTALREGLTVTRQTKQQIVDAAIESLPTVVGLSSDTQAPARAAILSANISAEVPATAGRVAVIKAKALAQFVLVIAEKANDLRQQGIDDGIYLRDRIIQVRDLYLESLSKIREVDALAINYVRALETYRTELSNGQTALANREVFRRRAAAAVQGYRTRDIAFRTFRTEALEEYQTLLDWASRYAFLAAQAYDYETGLLGSSDGQSFIGDIISSRALGILDDDGQPTLSASANGDPGLSGLLAKLKGDYDVVKGRLGFNNPETNGTTFSLRREYFRIPDGAEGDLAWQEVLENLVTANLIADADLAAHAMQLGGLEVAAQPGFLISFPTVIEAGKNFFGKELLAGDSDFSDTSFATKVNALGVVFEGYQGMSPCLICQGGPGDPTHNHDDALSATPDVFLIPTGLDTMRTPPLGDGSALRQWAVQDYAMPLPFDLGSQEPTREAVQQISNQLRVNFRSPRRHPSFRATDRADFFFSNFSQDYTSSRLVGRSVWNSEWKLAIPAKELLADETEAIARFIRTVTDIKLHLKTYSYSGN